MALSALSAVVPDDETFRARLRKSSTVNFSGACLLEIQRSLPPPPSLCECGVALSPCRDFDRNLFHIALFTESEPPRLIVRWQIDHIRQYGSNNMAFKFQSGRWAEFLPQQRVRDLFLLQQVIHWSRLVHCGHWCGSCCPHPQGSGLLGQAHCGSDQEHSA